MNPLPLSVIGGYLGAGKTTLINRLLSEDHGLRILVLVNDFGAINIDATLLISADEDTIELANGCVCCTMGADLFMAVGDALNRRPRPDHLIIEASGIADPARIAQVARAEPDLAYAGIVTVVDGNQIFDLLGDTRIAPQIEGQISCADILAVSKTAVTIPLRQALSDLNPDALMAPADKMDFSSMLLSDAVLEDAASLPHAAHTKWSHISDLSFDPEQLVNALTLRPDALFRVKGHLKGNSGVGILVQVVGHDICLSEIDQPERSTLIGIGLAQSLGEHECTRWEQQHLMTSLVNLPAHSK